MILEEQFPVPRYTAASKIGNGVISLLWQLRCGCNPDHNKVSSFSNTTVVSIFPNLCLWRRSLLSNLGGIDLEKLYRATLMVVKLCSLRAVIGKTNRVGSHKPPIAHFFVHLIAIKVQLRVREFLIKGSEPVLTVERMLQLFTTDSFHQSWLSFTVI